METDRFQSCGHCWVFQICWHIECSTFTASTLRVWYSSAVIPSNSLALFVVMLNKVHLTLHSRMSGFRWVLTPSWLSGSLRSFLYSSSVYSCYLFLTSSASVLGPYRFCPLLCPCFGEDNGTPLQYSCLENPMDGGAWWAAVHGVAKSRTRLSDFTFTFHFPALAGAFFTSIVTWEALITNYGSLLLPGKSHGRRSLVGCSPWGR